MQIVIEIDEDLYEMCRDSLGDEDNIEGIIANGTPLPKNHGRLIDADELEIDEIDNVRCYSILQVDESPTVQAVPIEVLNKIRAEIAEYKDDKIIHDERNEMIDIVLEIIDKYRESEGV